MCLMEIHMPALSWKWNERSKFNSRSQCGSKLITFLCFSVSIPGTLGTNRLVLELKKNSVLNYKLWTWRKKASCSSSIVKHQFSHMFIDCICQLAIWMTHLEHVYRYHCYGIQYIDTFLFPIHYVSEFQQDKYFLS